MKIRVIKKNRTWKGRGRTAIGKDIGNNMEEEETRAETMRDTRRLEVKPIRRLWGSSLPIMMCKVWQKTVAAAIS
jgi:hypothetical protein